MQRDAMREARRWLDQAVRDLDDARYNLAGGRHNLACFVAQQAAEKALKAFLIAKDEEPWGHSVADLCREAGGLDEAWVTLQAQVAPLDKFYIPTRYPNGLPGGIPAEAFSPADAESAIEMASLVIDQVSRTFA
jgi:HEPN domain-containing protein